MGLVWTIINLIVLFLLLRHFLINPVSNIMEQRRKLIADGLQNAQDTQDEANRLKAEYEEALSGAKKESAEIVDKARIDARAEYDRIVGEAGAKAGNIIENAKENAILNNINNVDFIAGDTEVVLDDLINNKKIIPNVVMVDPPRKGLDNRSIDNILKIKPDRVVYISCNPATLVRDLAKFEGNYVIEEIRPVDMFPFTKHVECVCLLELR